MILLSKKRYGYTLIEILVGLTIISLVFITGYISYREFSRRQLLGAASRQVIADLRLAQAQAFAGKKPGTIACADPNYLEGVSFFILNATSYRIAALCKPSSFYVTIKDVTFQSGVTINNPGLITFKVLGQGTNLSGYTVITLTANGASQNIMIGPGGTIEGL